MDDWMAILPFGSEPPPKLRPPQVEDRHPFGSPEYLEAYRRRYPHRVGMTGDQRRQNAQKETGQAMHAQRAGERCQTPACSWPTTEHRHDPGQPVLPPTWRNHD